MILHTRMKYLKNLLQFSSSRSNVLVGEDTHAYITAYPQQPSTALIIQKRSVLQNSSVLKGLVHLELKSTP